MNPAEAQLWIALVNAALPGGIALVKDIIALFKKYPGLTPAQVTVLVQTLAGQADSTYDSVIATINADEIAHPPKPGA